MKRIYRTLIICLAFGLASFPALEAKVTPPANKNTTTAANPAATFQRGMDAMANYDFNTAANLFRQYNNQQKDNTEDWASKAQIAANAFERVQKIVVIDSISMPRASFFEAFRLAKSAGNIGRTADFRLKTGRDNDEVGFLNESRDYLITSVPNEEGELRLVENLGLLDGSWETHDALIGDLELDGDYAFPFLGADGQTLYFANNGEGSMGGYDLFVVQKEPITGECLQPLNLGMPFNSPFDDFMMAIDEENGVGWWATDRNSPGEDVTIYVYILDDIRKNYPSDTPGLKSLAKISDYKATWEEGKEASYQKILKSLPK